ncbi:hypothetical protein ebA3486 [Aromatoleum aromaticum EbN1]|uniref:Uncharacterized protein n=1 Tax=Aromatoleum aromaticum (strain DSM 19018 / LMG 30748 / EbN1) TaxID=76114 RepID=Q5P3M3_AROAE|nr:hypothetical protein ebA3486 [Aromatoleum aromaticum EbN1]
MRQRSGGWRSRSRSRASPPFRSSSSTANSRCRARSRRRRWAPRSCSRCTSRKANRARLGAGTGTTGRRPRAPGPAVYTVAHGRCHAPAGAARRGTRRTLHPRVRPRRTERQQGFDGSGTALRRRAFAVAARRCPRPPAETGRAPRDVRRRDRDLRPALPHAGSQPRRRARPARGVDRPRP